MGTPTHRTRAAFLVNSSWQWHTWNHVHANSHAAIIAKGKALGAKGWDFGNSDHAEISRAGF